jgi:dihydroneopterin aldolase
VADDKSSDRRTAGAKRPAGSDGRTYRMFVRDLVVPCLLGVHRHERDGRQRVRINLDLEVAATTEPIDDRLANVVSYEAIVERVRGLCGEGHVNLAETLAARIVDTCLADPRVRWALVRLEKLEVFPDAASAGVEMERTRQKP